MNITGKTEPIQLGIIGAGAVTERLHLPSLRRVEAVQVVALADTDPARLTRVADYFGIERRWLDAQTLLEDASIEAVAICTPPAQHEPLGVEALRAGKHLFIEKPLALTLDEADRLCNQADRSDRLVLLGFNLRHHPRAQQARRLLLQGRLGRLVSVRSQFHTRQPVNIPDWRSATNEGGEPLLDLGVHHFDLWRFLLDLEIQEASASGDRWTCVVSARLTGNVEVKASFSQSADEANEIEIVGSQGKMSLSFYRMDGFRAAGWGPRLQSLRDGLLAWPEGLMASSYRRQWIHFADCLRTNTPPTATLEDGRQALQAILSTKKCYPGL